MRRRSWLLAVALAAGVGCSTPSAPAPRAVSGGVPPLTEGVTKSADGEPLVYRVGGRGEATIVFVHGWCIDQTYWNATMAAFASRARVVSLDLAGHGRSGRGRAAWTLDAYARDVEAVIDALKLERVALVGHSMSGDIVVEVARRRPERVAAVVGVDALQDAEEMTPPQRAKFVGWLREDFAGNGREFVGRLFLPGATGPSVDRVRASVARCPAEEATATLDSVLQYPKAERLAEVRAPVVCINAGLSKADPEGMRRRLARYEVVSMPGVGHYPMIEDPPRFATLLGEALQKAGVALP